MATRAQLRTGIALRVHDPSMAEITSDNYDYLINQAVNDLTSEQIVLPLAEDETTILGAATYTYTVPADFAYIKELRLESAVASGKYPTAIHPTLWRLTIETGTTPVIYFDENDFTIVVGAKVKVVGQKRVAEFAIGAGGDAVVVPVGLESFIRERAICYAAQIAAGGVSELSAWRRALAEECWQRSLFLLQRIPREYRPLPDAKRVPER